MKFKLIEAAESKICCICKKPFDGYGNNAEPVCSGSCCDECNMKEVIPARMKMLDDSSSKDLDEAILIEEPEVSDIPEVTTYLISGIDCIGDKYAITVNYRKRSKDFSVGRTNPKWVVGDSRLRFITEQDAIRCAEMLKEHYLLDSYSISPSKTKRSVVPIKAFLYEYSVDNAYVSINYLNYKGITDEFLNKGLVEKSSIVYDESLNEAIDPSKALEVKKNSDADVIFYGYQYKNEKPVEFDPPRELSGDEYKAEVQTIVGSKTKLNADKPTGNRYGYDRDFIFYTLYNRKNESIETHTQDNGALEYIKDRLVEFYVDEYFEKSFSEKEIAELAKNILNKLEENYPEMLDYVEYWGGGEDAADDMEDAGAPEECRWIIKNENFPEAFIYSYLQSIEGFSDPYNTDLVPYEGNLDILNTEKDDNKMNEVFGDIINYESAEDWIKRIESQEGQISIFDDEDKDTFEKFARDVYFYAKNNGFKRYYVEDDFIEFKKTSDIPEGELATFISITGNNHEIYLHAQLYGSDGFLIGEKYRPVHNMAELKSGINEIKDDAVKNIEERENEKQAKAQKIAQRYAASAPNIDIYKPQKDPDLRAKLKARHPELNFGDDVTESLDDDMDFDIDESHETRLMDSLYEGSDDFDEYDDEDVDEFSDCEDDECWENDLISDDYDDTTDEDYLDEDFSEVPESDEERGKYIWKISFDSASGQYEATNDVDDIYAHGATLKDCIEDLRSLVNEQAEMDGSVVVKKFSDKHVDYNESDLDNLGYVIVKFGRFRFW